MKWLDRGWWRYLLAGSPSWRRVVCRAKGHAGPVFWNPDGDEPNWSCRDCGENLA